MSSRSSLVGDVLRAQGNLTEAPNAYRASLDIAEKLAAQDPGNAGWQRDLRLVCREDSDRYGVRGDHSLRDEA